MATPKVALVTGASSGIGQATASLLAQHGYEVFGTSRQPAQHSADGFTLLPLDINSEESVQRCVQEVLTRAKRIDLLVNNAGYNQIGAIEENSVADAQTQFDTNVFGTLRMIQAVLPTMRQQGSGQIVNVSSVVGLTAVPYAGLYSASKFALEGLIDALRSEVAQFNIKVSLVEPGPIKTNLRDSPPAHPIAAYNAARQSVLGWLRHGIETGPEPITIANVILKISQTARPRLQNVIGRQMKLLTTLKRILPEPAYERVRNRIVRIPARGTEGQQLQSVPH